MDFDDFRQMKEDLIKYYPSSMQDINDLDDLWREEKWGEFCKMCNKLISYGVRVLIDDNGPHVQLYQKIYPNMEDSEYIDKE